MQQRDEGRALRNPFTFTTQANVQPITNWQRRFGMLHDIAFAATSHDAEWLKRAPPQKLKNGVEGHTTALYDGLPAGSIWGFNPELLIS